MKKQLVLLTMTLLSLPTIAYNYYDVKYDGIYYVFDAYKQAGVTYYNYNDYSGDVVIPKAIYPEGNYYPVRFIGDYAFKSCKDLTSVTFRGSIESIGNYAFQDCVGLQSFPMPTTISALGDYAFYGCSNITSFFIPYTLQSIGSFAFLGCGGLTSIIVDSTNPVYDSRQDCNAIIKTETNELITGCNTTVIPETVTSIASGAFNHCSLMTDIIIPNSVTIINGGAFAFCSSLSSVSIGRGVETIGDRAFRDCTSLTDVYCHAENVPTTHAQAFENVNVSEITLHVPEASVEKYSNASPWKNFKEIIAIKNTDPGIKKCATPTITTVNGKVSFECETEGVTFKSSYTFNTGNTDADSKEIILAGTTTCQVSVYAMKEGYENSDVATANVEIAWGKKGDTNGDGEVNVGDLVTTTNIIMGKDE